MGPAAGAVASMQALEILKLILGLETLKDKFAMLDFRLFNFSVTELTKREDCPACGGMVWLGKKFAGRMAVNLITPEELRVRLLSPVPPRLLDLRYEWEHGLCHIKGDAWVDFAALVKEGAGFDPEEEIVLYCKGRSKSTAAFRKLTDLGFQKISVLEGGIDAWAEKVDKGMLRY
jgi:adenylyltransferase/sulfurtransferase